MTRTNTKIARVNGFDIEMPMDYDPALISMHDVEHDNALRRVELDAWLYEQGRELAKEAIATAAPEHVAAAAADACPTEYDVESIEDRIGRKLSDDESLDLCDGYIEAFEDAAVKTA